MKTFSPYAIVFLSMNLPSISGVGLGPKREWLPIEYVEMASTLFLICLPVIRPCVTRQ